ncbi:MAG: MFS transporter [Chloroflexi bacterium]|nr:MFS transporter [Chloroflexota bacterium]
MLARRLPFHYAWVIVVAVGLAGALNADIRLAFGILIDPLVEEHGWSVGDISLAYTISFISMAVAGLTFGSVADRWGTPLTMLIGGSLVTLGLLLTAIATELWQLYLYYGVLAGFGGGAFVVPTVTTVTYWFKKWMGAATGTVYVIQGLGPVVGTPIIRIMLDNMGWKETFFILAIVTGAVMLVAALFIRTHPEDMGLRPYGDDGAVSNVAPTAKKRTPAQSLRTTITWTLSLLIIIHFAGCVSHSLPLAHVPYMAELQGISGPAAASILSVLSAVALISRFSVSVLADVVGGRWALGWALAVQGLAVLILLPADNLAMFYTFGAIFALGYGGEMVAFPILNRQVYPDRPTAGIYGYQIAGAALGMALGGYLGGLTKDLTGDYTVAVLVSAGAAALGLVAVVALPFGRRRVRAPTPVRP